MKTEIDLRYMGRSLPNIPRKPVIRPLRCFLPRGIRKDRRRVL
jgi:hypothetical protein